MKKAKYVLASVMLLSVLSGCKDASAKLKDSGTALFSVGSKTVTKGDVYSVMNSMDGASGAVSSATKYISSKEIEVTDEMKQNAQSTLESYLAYYGDSFTAYLEQNGMTQDEYVADYLIPSLQASELVKKYITDNFAALVERYKPVKATILTFTASEDADAALSELKDGSKSAAEAASGHNSSSNGQSQLYTTETSLDSLVRTVLTSSKPEDGWVKTPNADGSEFSLIHVDNADTESFRDEIITALAGITNVSSDSSTYWFKKYGFHIYDKTLYDAISADYPDYLVQDIKEAAETETAETDTAEK